MNPIIAYQRKSVICAEVLVPDSVAPKFIIGVYISCRETYKKVSELLVGSSLANNVFINTKLFFQ